MHVIAYFSVESLGFLIRDQVQEDTSVDIQFMTSVSNLCAESSQCPRMYVCDEGECVHSLLGFSGYQIVGMLSIALISGVSSMAGLGGGGPMLAILLVAYNYAPKKGTLLIYALILGATIGNVVNQATTSVGGKTMVKYRYAFVAIPFQFMGSLFGVIINKYFPSLFICLLIVLTTAKTLSGIYQKFKVSYQKETEVNKANEGSLLSSMDNEVTRINPLSNPENIYIFKRLGLLIVGFIILQLIRGSEKFSSIIGVQRCSPTYWLIELGVFVYVVVFGRMNIQTMTEWESKDHMLLQERESMRKISFQEKSKEIIKMSFLGGIYSGFGLGGGLFLVPMFRDLGLDQLQSTATVAFCIAVIAFSNTIQAFFIGAMSILQLIYFFSICSVGSFFISKYLSMQFRKRNRLSYIELLLVILLGISVINIPYGLILKYISSGYDSSILLGFGELC